MTQEKTAPKDFLGLRTKREASGLTLKDICQSTRVSVVNLEAIENGEFHDLPVPIYTRNFIKNYAHALNLDSKPILESYEAYLDSLQIAEEPIPEAEPLKEPFIKRVAHYKSYIVLASIIIVVSVGAFIISQQKPVPVVTVNQPAIIETTPQVAVSAPENQPEQAVQPAQTIQPTQTKIAAQPVPAEDIKQVPPQPKSSAPIKPIPKQNIPVIEKKAPVITTPPQQQSPVQLKDNPKQNAPVVKKAVPALMSEGTDILVVKATEETWLRMKIDKNPAFQVLLKPGEEIRRKGADFEVDVGNAGGIVMQFKGKTIENLGKSGEVVHLQLP